MADKLHQFIQALSKSEKRYFKLYAKRFSDKEDSLKIKIFDAISKQSEYEEDKVLKKLGKKFKKSRYSVEKVHLYQMILDSLTAYHSKSFKEIEILQALQTIRILWIKGQTKAAQQLVNKYKKVLVKQHGTLNHYLLNFLTFEKLLVYNVIDRDKQQEHINNIIEEYDTTLQKLDETNKISHLIAQGNYLRNDKYCPRNPELVKPVKKFLQHPLLQDGVKYLRPYSRYNALRIKFHLSCYLKEYEYLHEMIDEVIANIPPMDIKQEISVVTYCLNLLTKMETYLYVNQEDAPQRMKELAAEIRSIPKKHASKEKLHVGVYFSVLHSYAKELHYAIQHFDSETIKAKTQALLTEMAAMPDTMDLARKATRSQDLYFDIYHSLSKAFLTLGELDRAMDFNYHILNMGDNMFMPWDYRKALFLSIIIHFDLGNYRLLPYQIDKLEHFLKKIEAPFRLEQQMAKGLKKAISYAENSPEQIEELALLKVKIDELLKDPYEKMEMVDFDYWNWLNQKFKKPNSA